jgi:hypothetical protein
MKLIHFFLQTFFLLAIPFFGNAETTCQDKVKVLEIERNHAVSIGGMWGYFEKNFNLPKIPTEAIQLDSRINKIFFLLDHLCDTQNGIPLTPLAIYISKNLSNKGKDKFINELLLIGKTPQRIKEWFQFYNYSKNNMSRILINSKVHKAVDQSIPLVKRYVRLTEITPSMKSINESFKKMKALVIDLDKLLSSQPYLSQALEETSHFLYWDISEGDLG